jgi:DegV family protein with EDD domain
MSKVAIVTDSTAYLSEELVKEYDITVLPLIVIWGDECLRDNIDISPNAFYERLQSAKNMPSTSQVTVQSFTDAFSELHSKGYQILTITLSAALSGTMDSAIQAKKMLPEATIELVDSQFTSLPLAYMALSAARAAKRGASLAQCRQIVESIRGQIEVFFAVETLEFLHRGGRIGGASRFLGTALNLKPILQIQAGKVEALERVRTSKKAQERLLELLEDNINGHKPLNMIGVVNAMAAESASDLLNQINSRFNPDEVLIADLSPVLGTHVGPGTVGVAYCVGVDLNSFENSL